MIQYPLGVAGTVTRVIEDGQGEDVIVFVHGLSTRADRWRGNVQALAAQGFRCIAFDLPGHGLAAKPAGFDYSVPGMAAFLGGVLDALGVQRCALVSTSLGSHIAGWFAVGAPQRVHAHVMVDALGLVPIAQATGEGISRSVRDTSREGIRGKLGNVFFDPARHATEALIEEEWRVNNSPGALAALSALGEYVATRLNGDLVGAKVRECLDRTRVRMLWGAEDKLVPLSVGEAALKELPGVELKVIARSGHAPYIEQPEEFNRLVAEFVRPKSV